MEVTNINGASASPCACTSWLEHWKKFSGKPLSPYCSEKWCVEGPDVGTHVQAVNTDNQAWFVIPLCKAHSGGADKSLQIAETAVLVLADQTCRKP